MTSVPLKIHYDLSFALYKNKILYELSFTLFSWMSADKSATRFPETDLCVCVCVCVCNTAQSVRAAVEVYQKLNGSF